MSWQNISKNDVKNGEDKVDFDGEWDEHQPCLYPRDSQDTNNVYESFEGG